MAMHLPNEEFYFEEYGIHKSDCVPSPIGDFIDGEEAIMEIVRQLYESYSLNKRALHNAVWYLVITQCNGKNERCLDLMEPQDLCVEHWREESIRKMNI